MNMELTFSVTRKTIWLLCRECGNPVLHMYPDEDGDFCDLSTVVGEAENHLLKCRSNQPVEESR